MKTRCRSCDARIEMLKTTRGRWMPVDLEPTLVGNVRVDDSVAVVLAGDALDAARARGDELRTSHMATCPQAGRHRRPR